MSRIKKTKFQKTMSEQSTKSVRKFNLMVKATEYSNPLLLISEGDSWYDYPGYNLIDHLQKRLYKNKIAFQILRLENNGAEAVGMLSRKQRHRISKLLKKYSNKIDVLFFDGGGNDVVGKWDLPFIIRDKPHGDPNEFSSWIIKRRLDRRMKQIENAYLDLVDIRDDYSPTTTIITHTYDLVIPDGTKAKFLLGLIKSGPWLKPYLKHIPLEHHVPIVDHILGRIKPIVEKLSATKNRFVVAPTQGTLKRQKKYWANELHPNKKGFELVGEKLWKVLIKVPEVKKRLKP